MSALPQRSKLPVRRSPPTKRRTHPQQRRNNRYQKAQRQDFLLAAETTLKLGVNLAISAIAVAALVRMTPPLANQQAKLQELKAEVQRTEERVSHLQAEFRHNFDPAQVRVVAQEQTHLVDPSRTAIVWVEGKGQTAAQLPR
jgi:cell division protein FtsB